MTTIVDSLLLRMGWLPKPAAPPTVVEKKMDAVEELCNIPRYPPFLNGLPVHEPSTLLDTQKELTDSISQIIADQELLNNHYRPAMLNLAALVQLLPASQAHHHRGAGGMLRHSIEVGLWALQQTEGKIIRGVVTPQQRRVIEPRWRLSVFLAGLCHDLGKVITDMAISDRDETTRWRPYHQSLYHWARHHHIETYFIKWQEDRGKKHTNVSSTLIGAVIGRDTLDWISDGGSDALIWLTESLNNNPGATNQVHHFVVKADQLSVERDLKSLGVAMAGYEIGVPIERYLTDIMRRLLREGVWRINEPSARVWNIDGTTYLVWPMAGEEIASVARRDDIPGLPKTADGILDMMVERELAYLRDNEDDPFFYIAPDVVTEKIKNMRMKAIRLRDQALISATPIPPITGKIHASKTEESPARATTEETPAPTTPAPHTGESSATPARLEVEKEGAEQLQSVCSTPTENPVAPAAQLQSNSSASAQQASVDVQTPMQRGIGPARLGLDDLDGPMGEVLRVLLSEFKSGKKSFSDMVVKQADGCVYLKWPHAFEGLGFSGKQILDGLSGAGWIIAASDVAKVGDTEFPGGTAKSIKLAATVGHLFMADDALPPMKVQADAAAPAKPAKPAKKPARRSSKKEESKHELDDMPTSMAESGCLARIHLIRPARTLQLMRDSH